MTITEMAYLIDEVLSQRREHRIKLSEREQVILNMAQGLVSSGKQPSKAEQYAVNKLYHWTQQKIDNKNMRRL